MKYVDHERIMRETKAHYEKVIGTRDACIAAQEDMIVYLRTQLESAQQDYRNACEPVVYDVPSEEDPEYAAWVEWQVEQAERSNEFPTVITSMDWETNETEERGAK
jgi:hypothetical protein